MQSVFVKMFFSYGGWTGMQIFVDKCKRLVQGVCIDSATRGFLSYSSGAVGRTRKAIT